LRDGGERTARTGSLCGAGRRFFVQGIAAAAFLTLFFATATAGAAPQEPEPAAPVLGPGDPLPPFRLDFANGAVEDVGTRTVITGGALRFGDVRIQADRIEFDRETQDLEATGSVVLSRGDEVLRAASFRFDAATGIGTAEDAVAVSPPFYVAARRIERTPTALVARDALLTPCPEGKGELRVTAPEITLRTAERTLVARRPTLSLFGLRLISLTGLRRSLGPERGNAASLPVRLRSSRISGFSVGAELPFRVGAGYEGTATIDVPTRQSPQAAVLLERRLLGPPRPPAPPTGPRESPLRQFLRARPLPPPPDDVLDFEDILPTPSPLSRPGRTVDRDLRLQMIASANQEFGAKRGADLLLSQRPEIQLSLRLPAPGAAFAPDDAAPAAGGRDRRAKLRRLRPFLTAAVSAGRFEERNLTQNGRTTARSRFAGSVGLESLPLLLGGTGCCCARSCRSRRCPTRAGGATGTRR
jgi:hypothetical protein